VAILSHNKPAGYIVSPEAYRAMLDGMEDKALGKIVEKRKGSMRKAISPSLDTT
jgi:PHD/YefM family antitoxin component YafN of YafNO toxin-antitoxin module